MRIVAKSKAEYFDLSGERASDLVEVDRLILKYAPDVKPVDFDKFEYGIGYGMMKYQSKSMKEASDWPLLALAVQKNHMALYACAVLDGEYVAEKYANKLGKVNCGKSCIRFKKASDLDETGLATMLKELNEHYKSGKKLYGI